MGCVVLIHGGGAYRYGPIAPTYVGAGRSGARTRDFRLGRGSPGRFPRIGERDARRLGALSDHG
jgi:hypothetical protein